MSTDDLADIISSMTDHTTDPARPFTGQPHTENGERGKTEIKGIRFRDFELQRRRVQIGLRRRGPISIDAECSNSS